MKNSWALLVAEWRATLFSLPLNCSSSSYFKSRAAFEAYSFFYWDKVACYFGHCPSSLVILLKVQHFGDLLCSRHQVMVGVGGRGCFLVDPSLSSTGPASASAGITLLPSPSGGNIRSPKRCSFFNEVTKMMDSVQCKSRTYCSTP